MKNGGEIHPINIFGKVLKILFGQLTLNLGKYI